jgi:hypothetical protein
LRNSCLRRNTLWDTMKTSGWIPKVKVGCNTGYLGNLFITYGIEILQLMQWNFGTSSSITQPPRTPTWRRAPTWWPSFRALRLNTKSVRCLVPIRSHHSHH